MLARRNSLNLKPLLGFSVALAATAGQAQSGPVFFSDGRPLFLPNDRPALDGNGFFNVRQEIQADNFSEAVTILNKADKEDRFKAIQKDLETKLGVIAAKLVTLEDDQDATKVYTDEAINKLAPTIYALALANNIGDWDGLEKAVNDPSQANLDAAKTAYEKRMVMPENLQQTQQVLKAVAIFAVTIRAGENGSDSAKADADTYSTLLTVAIEGLKAKYTQVKDAPAAWLQDPVKKGALSIALVLNRSTNNKKFWPNAVDLIQGVLNAAHAPVVKLAPVPVQNAAPVLLLPSAVFTKTVQILHDNLDKHGKLNRKALKDNFGKLLNDRILALTTLRDDTELTAASTELENTLTPLVVAMLLKTDGKDDWQAKLKIAVQDPADTAKTAEAYKAFCDKMGSEDKASAFLSTISESMVTAGAQLIAYGVGAENGALQQATDYQTILRTAIEVVNAGYKHATDMKSDPEKLSNPQQQGAGIGFFFNRTEGVFFEPGKTLKWIEAEATRIGTKIHPQKKVPMSYNGVSFVAVLTP